MKGTSSFDQFDPFSQMTQKVCYIKRKNSEILSKLRNSESAEGSETGPPQKCFDWPPPKLSKCWNHIHFARHLGVFRSEGGPVWDSNVFLKSVTYRPTLSKFRGGQLKKTPCRLFVRETTPQPLLCLQYHHTPAGALDMDYYFLQSLNSQTPPSLA